MSSTTPYGHFNASGKSPAIQGQVIQASPYGNSSVAQDMKPEDSSGGRPCRDLFWALLFYGHLGVLGYLAVLYGPAMVDEVYEGAQDNGGGGGGGGGQRSLLSFLDSSTVDRVAEEEGSQRSLLPLRFLQDGDNGEQEDFQIDPSTLIVVLCITSVLGFVVSTLALGFMMSFAEALIKIALFFNIILFGLMTVLTLLTGAVGAALMTGLMFAFACYYTWKVWSRIPFAAANLVTAVTAVKSNLGLAFYAYISMVVLFGWSIFWSVSAISTIYVTNGCNAQGECDSAVNPGILFLFLVSYYWTIQVIGNVVHCTVAGTVGTWWMAPQEANGCCSSAVRDSYVRSMTTSFGSICLGSLLVAIIQAAKEMVHQARESDDSILACCAECLLGLLESLAELFNKWAFVYVGLYGFSFMEAGKNVMTLFRNRGWTAIITDFMVDTVLFMVSLGVGFLTGILGAVIAAAMQLNDSASMGISFMVGLVAGYGLCATLLSVVSSAVNTVVVCYAEAPQEFQQNHPELSERMRGAWRQAWPNDFQY